MNATIWANFSDDDLTSIDEYIAAVLGPKRLPLNRLMPLTIVYGVIFSTGLLGNFCTCLVIASNPYMQTATNCYLFNLAVADVLTLICAMPLELYSLWHQYPWELGNWTCIMRTVMSEATAYASILTIATFSCEQYIAVCYPLRPSTKSKLKRAFRNIIIIWIVSFVSAAPYGLFTKVNYLTLEPEGEVLFESAWCGFPFNDPDRKWETLMLCSTFLFFVVPVTLITVLYCRISLTLHKARNLYRSETTGQSSTDVQRSRIRSRRVIIRMLIAVVVAFFVCWAPYHSQRLLFLYVSLYGEWTETLRKINQDLFSVAGCFYYFNSTINPLLYSVMSNRFRVAFRERLCAGNPCTCLLCFCCCCWKWCQSRFNDFSSSGSSSQRTPHVNLPLPTPEPLMQTRLNTNTRDRVISDVKKCGEYPGLSHSDDRNGNLEKLYRPRFSSDPNFSLRLMSSQMRDFLNTNGTEFSLARENASPESRNCIDECVNGSSCNSVFSTKQKQVIYTPLAQMNKSPLINNTKRTCVNEESTL